MKYLSLAASAFSCRLGLPPRPAFYVLQLTDSCNLGCIMCRQWKKPLAEEASTASWIGIIRQIASAGGAAVVLTGGEPFLRKDLPVIVEETMRQGISCHICTNGSMEEGIRRLSSHPPTSLSFSLDSHDPSVHNSIRGSDCHTKAISSIKAARKLRRTRIGINFLVTRHNYKNLLDTARLASELGVQRFNIMPYHDNLQQKDCKEASGSLVLEPAQVIELMRRIPEVLAFLRRERIVSVSSTFLSSMQGFMLGRRPRHACVAGRLIAYIDPRLGLSPCQDFSRSIDLRKESLSMSLSSTRYSSMLAKVRACDAVCWDTTYAELSILCHGFPKELGRIFSDLMYYR